MTLYALLTAGLAILGAFVGLRRKAARATARAERAEVDRDAARGKVATAEAQAAVVAEVAVEKAEAVVVATDYRREVEATVAAIPEPTAAQIVEAATAARRKVAAAEKVRRATAARRRGK